MKFRNIKNVDPSYLSISLCLFIMGICNKFFWIPATLFLILSFLED
jgi:hypothetical protein